MKVKRAIGRPKCFGSTTVGPKGQVVIPAHARKELDINSGDTLLAFRALMGFKGLLLVKADTVEELLSMMSENVLHLEGVVREQRAKVTKVGKGE